MAFLQIALFNSLPGQNEVLIFEKYLKIFCSETIRGMKLKLIIHAYDISLFINCVLLFSGIRTLVAMATHIFHILTMGKAEIDCFCCLIEDI